LVSSLASAALATVVLGVAACGTTTSPSPTPTPEDSSTPTAAPPETASPTPTGDPTDAAILNAYDQAIAAWDAAAAIPNPQHPGISEWNTGAVLTLVQARLGALHQYGYVEVGTYTPHPSVTSVDGALATVQDCGWDTRYFVYEGTTTPVSPQPFGYSTASGWDNVSATLALQSGTWQLSDVVLESTPCTPA
jgi:hypothetical protein